MNSLSSASKKQNLFFQNLLVLGFDVSAMKEEHRTAFDKEMFCKPNLKAFEVVSYFLFMKLNEVSPKKYTILWPLLEVKAHTQFKKTCFSHLTSIAQESEIRFPLVSQSVLSSFGNPFYELYFAFSTHVVLKTNENYGTPILRRAKVDHRYHKHFIRILKVSTISAVNEFIEVTEVSKRHLETYFSCAKNLMMFIEKLKIANASFESLVKERKKIISSLYEGKSSTEETSFDNAISKNEEYQKKIEECWIQLENFLSKEEELWSFLNTELEDEKKKPVLEGSQLNLSIQDSLNESHCSDHKHQLWTESKGLNFKELLKMFSCVLELYSNSILKGNFSQTRLFDLLKDKTECEATFKRLKHLNDQLQKDSMLAKNNVKQHMDNFKFSEDVKNTIYEDLPPSPSACINTKSVSVVDLEKFINPSIEESQGEVESALSNNGNNSNNECSHKPSSQTVFHSQVEANVESDFLNLCPQKSTFSVESKNDLVDLTEPEEENSDKSGNIPSGNTPGFSLPLSWLLEESLNSQTLMDDMSFLE